MALDSFSDHPFGMPTPFGRGSIFDQYKAAGIAPDLVADFESGIYATSGVFGFPDLLTHSRAGNGTVEDSDGLVKWGAHNLLTYSEDLTHADWDVSTVNSTVTDQGDGVFRLEMTAADNFYGQTIGAGIEQTFEVEVKSNTGASQNLRIRLYDGTTQTYQSVTATSEWTTVSVYAAQAGVGVHNAIFRTTATPEAVDILVRRPRVYRSDLGGMQNNPDRGDSYVPTTSAAVYMRREDYASGAKRVLIEEAATNLFVESNDFTAATGAWVGTNTGTLANDAQGPDGLATSATTLVDSAVTGSNTVFVAETVTVSTSTAYTASVYAKEGQLSWFLLYVRNFTTPANGGVYFNLSTGSVGTEDAGIVGQIEDVGSGWYRCSITFTTDAADTTGDIRIYTANGDGDPIVDLDGTSSILIWGAQFEAGSVPTSPIPTNGAEAERPADSIYVPSANLPAYTNAVSFALDGEKTYADTSDLLEVYHLRWFADGSNYIYERMSTSGADTGKIEFGQAESGTVDTVQSATDAYSPGINVAFSIASRHGSNFINGAVDGVALTEDTTPTAIFDGSSTDLYLAYSGGPMRLKSFRMWNVDIGDTGIAEAS